MNQRRVILLFGPPGCGKGTQAAYIARRFGIPAVSTGEMFRAECKAGSPLGKLACSILSSGGLVPDEVVNETLSAHLLQPRFGRGFLLDGYPRTVPQAVFLSGLVAARRFPDPVILHLDVAPEALISRLCARRQCPACGRIYNLHSQPPRKPGVCDADGAELVRREDDREDVIRQRLEAYRKLTDPVLRYYAGSPYYRIDGSYAPEEVSRQVESVLEETAPAGGGRRLFLL